MAAKNINLEELLKQVFSKTNQLECNIFLMDVALRLGILDSAVPQGRADDIIEFISTHPEYWMSVGKGSLDGLKAATLAGQGFLVVALLKAKDHVSYKHHSGHVAFVLPPPLIDKYPRLICAGKAEGRSSGGKAVYAGNYRGVWTKLDAPLVQYYQYVTPLDKILGI